MLERGWVRDLQEEVLGWYSVNGRDLPWRRTSDPYTIWVSEVMLQQTQAERVAPKYEVFLHRFPRVEDLAAARLADVLTLWSGLGYNRRAKHLWEAARIVSHPELDSGFLPLEKDPGASPQDDRGNIVRRNSDVLTHTAHALPQTASALAKLPGIGPYTASAIACFAYNSPEVLLETNTRRIYQLLWTGSGVKPATLHGLGESLLPRDRPAAWHHALMDLGSLARGYRLASEQQKFLIGLFPMLSELPLPHFPGDRVERPRQSRFEGSHRQIRGGVLKVLGDGSLDKRKLSQIFPDDRLEKVLRELEAEGFVSAAGNRFQLA